MERRGKATLYWWHSSLSWRYFVSRYLHFCFVWTFHFCDQICVFGMGTICKLETWYHLYFCDNNLKNQQCVFYIFHCLRNTWQHFASDLQDARTRVNCMHEIGLIMNRELNFPQPVNNLSTLASDYNWVEEMALLTRQELPAGKWILISGERGLKKMPFYALFCPCPSKHTL